MIQVQPESGIGAESVAWLRGGAGELKLGQRGLPLPSAFGSLLRALTGHSRMHLISNDQ